LYSSFKKSTKVVVIAAVLPLVSLPLSPYMTNYSIDNFEKEKEKEK